MTEEKNLKAPHSVVLEGRKKMSVTGVNDMDSFDEQTMVLYTSEGEMLIKGDGLHIIKIDVDIGQLSLEGEVYSISYSDNQASKGSIFSRLFR